MKVMPEIVPLMIGIWLVISVTEVATVEISVSLVRRMNKRSEDICIDTNRYTIIKEKKRRAMR
ncbi:hypothetical protein GOQ27_12050 [Clostridium sp. D2Q-11]|uniref:Uncharacterized protein n=1 Tax=Anaeromonas frigoriresistens TaxID=2683708 RepID=A0A942Z9J5_9FIRM|nr:hypothetical protein [Anaeromonas frigoriresistens]MBS4539199.1 hypothetical protein [Anaeromonas frigoriresistens]